MKSSRVKIIVLVFACFTIICLAKGWEKLSLKHHEIPVMGYPFKKVTRFSRPVIFLSLIILSEPPDGQFVKTHLYYLDSSCDGRLRKGPAVHRDTVGSFGNAGIIGIRPDGSRIYISAENKLLELDSDLNVQRRIPITAFKFNPDEIKPAFKAGPNGVKFEFARYGKASNEKLWFAVNKVRQESTSKRYTTFLVEWCLKDLPQTRLIGDGDFDISDGIAVDGHNRRVFTFGSPTMEIFNFSTQKREEPPYGTYYFIDFDKEKGLLLSKSAIRHKGEKPIILKLDKLNGTRTVVTEGLCAVWGSDGYIYFSNARFDLWRCKPDGSDRGLIHSGASRAEEINLIHTPPKVSHDHTFLAYSYTHDAGKYGTLLIDLKSKEYIELSRERFGYNKMAWLVKNTSEPAGQWQ